MNLKRISVALVLIFCAAWLASGCDAADLGGSVPTVRSYFGTLTMTYASIESQFGTRQMAPCTGQAVSTDVTIILEADGTTAEMQYRPIGIEPSLSTNGNVVCTNTAGTSFARLPGIYAGSEFRFEASPPQSDWSGSYVWSGVFDDTTLDGEGLATLLWDTPYGEVKVHIEYDIIARREF